MFCLRQSYKNFSFLWMYSSVNLHCDGSHQTYDVVVLICVPPGVTFLIVWSLLPFESQDQLAQWTPLGRFSNMYSI